MRKFFYHLLRETASLSGGVAGLIPLLGEERPTLPPLEHGQPLGWTLFFLS
jgi:hypothetical protein